jgi:acetone carboxylase gamma subunit
MPQTVDLRQRLVALCDCDVTFGTHRRNQRVQATAPVSENCCA